MDRDTRQKIAMLSGRIDALETTRGLIKTSNVLCFTTMDRGPGETVTIEFAGPRPDNSKMATNRIIETARDEMISYLDVKIKGLNEEIDNLLKNAQ